MPARKSPPAKAPGQSVQEWQRHTTRLVVRCAPELAERARRIAEERGRTLSQVLEAGIEATERD